MVRLHIIRVVTSLSAASFVALAAAPTASAATLLTRISGSGFQVQLADGTSNTIAFGESTVLDVCVPAAAFQPVVGDGTSNTLLFTESLGLRTRWTSTTPGTIDGTSNTILFGEDTCLQGIVDPEPVVVPPGAITDGTSNTLLFGESVIDLRNRTFSVCFSQVRVAPIVDGTSNTLLIGEQPWSDPCYDQVQAAPDLQVPGPAAGGLLALSLAGILARRRRPRA